VRRRIYIVFGGPCPNLRSGSVRHLDELCIERNVRTDTRALKKEGHMNIKGIDKALVLAALYNASRPLGSGWVAFDPKPMMREEARAMLERDTYFDYVKGRVVKVDLSSDDVSLAAYDRDNGSSAGERAILAAVAASQP